MLRVDTYTQTHIGNVRKTNEDTFSCFPMQGCLVAVVVCDGMGGLQAGELASQSAVDTLDQYLSKATIHSDSAEAFGDLLQDGIVSANAAVHAVARQLVASIAVEDKPLAGTTLVVGVIHGRTLTVGHVGDSRAYLLRDGTMQPLTEDHSFVAEQVKLGNMTDEEARKSRYRNVITRAVGISPTVVSDIKHVDLSGGDRILICTDGLTTMVEDDTICKILMETPGGDRAGQRLIAVALEKGGTDNVTVCVMDVLDGVGDSRILGERRGHISRSTEQYNSFAAHGFSEPSAEQQVEHGSLQVESIQQLQRPQPSKRRVLTGSLQPWTLPFTITGVVAVLFILAIVASDDLRVSIGQRLSGTSAVFDVTPRPEFATLKYKAPSVYMKQTRARAGILAWSGAVGPVWVDAAVNKVFFLNKEGVPEDKAERRPRESINAITVDPDGNIYLCDATQGIIERISASGGHDTIVKKLKNPSALALDQRDGTLYYIDGGILYALKPTD